MITIEEVLQEIEGKLASFKFEPKFENEGRVLAVGDGVVSILGLGRAKLGEEVVFEGNIRGQIIELDEDKVWAIVFGEFEMIRENTKVKSTNKILEIGVSEDVLGRVINPLGLPLDGGNLIKPKKAMTIEKIAPGVTQRAPVNTPLRTGIKVIDSLIPIGRGQRELIIGDRSTGKTSIALDSILNQDDVISIYVAIGQKQSNVAQIVGKLKEAGALQRTVIISANSSEPPSLQYIAPYAGCSIAEYFMEQGRDVLIVYDDLTKHAWAYRQISLILKKPSGREAYPGDIFYLHSRLLERSCKLSKKFGGGSLTALPIVETHGGDISTYIPTNVISITDGQIYLESDLFYAGIRPAVNIGLSVSRVGGAAQTKKLKTVAGPLRLELAQYRELAVFSQFGSDLDQATREKLERGARLTEILKQPQFSPLTETELVLILYIATKGFLDDVEVTRCRQFEEEFLQFMQDSQEKLLVKIDNADAMSSEIEKDLQKAITHFKNKIWQI